MAKYSNLNSLFTDIADAIREKSDSTDAITAEDFPQEILNLKNGFDYTNKLITTIPNYTFYKCDALTSVNCSRLKDIGDGAFTDCKNLKTVTLYNGITNIGRGAFSGCSKLTDINIPDKVIDIGIEAFENCSALSSINIPEGITVIGENTFYGCSSLTSVGTPTTLTEIGYSAFEGCKAWRLWC